MNIGTLLPRHARFRPEHVAQIVNQQSLIFRELNIEVNKLANALLAAGKTLKRTIRDQYMQNRPVISK